ncbi:MAG: cytochrome b N-terminal domain-containing protein [Thermodesulfovibrionales bacterium]|nr:cytochrome b N-terminal domain-containing protein [Thermodesulfovibrionales bacterium]
MARLTDWFLDRFGLRNPHKRFLERPVPPGLSYFYCLGGMAFTSFMILVFSGAFLTFFYVPSEKEAFQSIVRLNNEVPLGRFIRSVHKWSATLLIISIILHGLRVFISRAYLPPRELNWVSGVCLFILAMLEGFTGYLLPWDQKAYWATVVGTNIISLIPLVGDDILMVIRGGPEVSGATLTRFYGLHIIWVPLLMFLLLWVHFHMVRKLGISRPL